jgi:hypothetical protein
MVYGSGASQVPASGGHEVLEVAGQVIAEAPHNSAGTAGRELEAAGEADPHGVARRQEWICEAAVAKAKERGTGCVKSTQGT